MKKIIRILALCLCIVIVMQCMPAEQYQYIAMEDVLLSEDIDVEFAENQIDSIQQYRRMLDNFNKNGKIRSAEEQVYDENYGGAYIDKDGNLVVLLVENDDNEVESIKNDTGNVNIKTESCNYSFNEMLDAINIMNDNLEYLLNRGIYITEMYEDVYANTVKIGVYELDASKETVIRDLVNSRCVDIYNTNSFSETNSAIYVKGGEKIETNDDGWDSTIGFCATRNGTKGVVISGHAVEYINQVFSYNNTSIGKVTANALSTFCSADAAFLETYSSVYTTNYIGDIAICHNTATSISDYPVGAMIYKYGVSTNLTGGTITSNYYTATYDLNYNGVGDHYISNQSTATYASADKDSGSPVFIIEGMYNGKYTCQLLGIHCGRNPDNEALISKYYKIVEALNVEAKTY